MIGLGFLCYVAGAVITAGIIGGVRDEMDGIADLAIIVFWPLALIVMAIKKLCSGFYSIGRWIGGKADSGKN